MFPFSLHSSKKFLKRHRSCFKLTNQDQVNRALEIICHQGNSSIPNNINIMPSDKNHFLEPLRYPALPAILYPGLKERRKKKKIAQNISCGWTPTFPHQTTI